MAFDTLTYTDTSTYADSIYYDFGDSSYSSTPNGTHVYGQNDLFTVTQYAYRCGRVDTTSVVVQSVILFDISEQQQELVNLKQLDQFWPPNLQSVHLYSLDGKLCWSSQRSNPSNLPDGLPRILVIEATWNNGLRTRQRYFSKQ